MRQITRQAVNAFYSRNNFKLSNTEVKNFENGNTGLFLFGNRIAILTKDNTLAFCCCGWDSPTTLERLRGLGLNIRKVKGQLRYAGAIIDPYKEYTALHNEQYLIRS